MNSVRKEMSSEDLDTARIIELRRKIHDENYVNNAVQRIAVVLSRSIVEQPKGFKEVVNGAY